MLAMVTEVDGQVNNIVPPTQHSLGLRAMAGCGFVTQTRFPVYNGEGIAPQLAVLGAQTLNPS